MSAMLDPINRSFWFSRMYFAVSVPEGRNSITSWGQEYNCGLFEVFQSCRFETKTMSRTKSYCYPIQRLPQSGHYRRRMRTRLKSDKHKAGIKSGTGRDGTEQAALLLETEEVLRFISWKI